jgi:hypothetical protein
MGSRILSPVVGSNFMPLKQRAVPTLAGSGLVCESALKVRKADGRLDLSIPLANSRIGLLGKSSRR